MVLSKIKEAFSSNDEKYEVLYHNYSKIKQENKNLKKKHSEELENYKKDVHRNIAKNLIELYQDIEIARESGSKVVASSKDIQQLLVDVNKTEKSLKKIMKEYGVEENIPKERFYDPEIHEASGYQDANGMQKGVIIKTVSKGFSYRGEIIKKPRVIVTK